MFYNFLCTSLALLWLNLCQSIFFFKNFFYVFVAVLGLCWLCIAVGFSLQWLALLCLEGLVALQPVGSSCMRAGTHVPLAGRHPHWTTREVPKIYYSFWYYSGICFLISFSDCSLLMYRNTTYFYILILYLTTLLKLFTLIFLCGDSF